MIYVKILVLLLLNERVTVFALTFSVRKSKFGVFNPGFFFLFLLFLIYGSLVQNPPSSARAAGLIPGSRR